MLDVKFIRDNLDQVKAALAKKGFMFDEAEFTRLDDARKAALTSAQSLQAEKKKASKQIGALIGQGMSPEDAKAQVMGSIDSDIGEAEHAAKQAEHSLRELLMSIPNVPHNEVPFGADESDNIEVLSWGEPVAFSFAAKDHVDLGEPLGLSFDDGALVAGSRFVAMSGAMARLHRAITQFMLDTHSEEHGYEETYVPYLVNRQALEGTGQLPKFEEDLFKVPGEKDFYLIPTAEVPVTNLLRDSVTDKTLPIKKVAHTPCFRSEAGSYGRDTRGMIRQHQFDKVELVQFVRPQDSDAALEELTGHAEAILQKLNLPYRKSSCVVVILASLRLKPTIWKSGCRVSRNTVKSLPAAPSVIIRRVVCRPAGVTRKPVSLSCCIPSMALVWPLAALWSRYWKIISRKTAVLSCLKRCALICAAWKLFAHDEPAPGAAGQCTAFCSCGWRPGRCP